MTEFMTFVFTQIGNCFTFVFNFNLFNGITLWQLVVYITIATFTIKLINNKR
jgi:hypothetical protein